MKVIGNTQAASKDAPQQAREVRSLSAVVDGFRFNSGGSSLRIRATLVSGVSGSSFAFIFLNKLLPKLDSSNV